MSQLNLYMSTVTGNMEIKKKQQKIMMILEGKKIPFEMLDISSSSDLKDRMRQIAGNDKALPPQICNGDVYCGDYEAFEEAVESEELNSFLKL